MLQRLILFLWRWQIIINSDGGGLSTGSISPAYLWVGVDHVIRGVNRARTHSLVLDRRHLPGLHSLVDVKFDELL